MAGLGSLWKALTGGEPAGRDPLSSSPARAPVPPRPAPVFEPWSEDEALPADTRTAERFVPSRTATVLVMADGKRVPARIINMSRTGVAVETGAAAVVGAEVTMVGTRPVTHGRRIALGQVFLFRKPIDPKLCGPGIVL